MRILYIELPSLSTNETVDVYGKDVQFQVDLADMTTYSKENYNITFLLTCIDVFGKYAWCRILKTKVVLK